MTAEEKLRSLTAWDSEPTLSEDELSDALSAAARPDAAGFAPLDEEWTPTHDVYSAAGRLWLIKAGRAASITETDPETGAKDTPVFRNCLEMARIYGRKRQTMVHF